MNSMWMIFAILIMLGITLFYYHVMKITSMEGFLLAIVTVIAAMYLGTKAHHLWVGIGILAGMAFLGIFCMCFRRKKEAEVSDFFSPALTAVLVLYGFTLISFHGDFIQNIDDFHQWAASVKYILYKQQLPVAGDFIGTASMPMLPSLFYVYFQKMGGYNEGNMYVSSFLFSSAVILLPFCKEKWGNSKKILVYSLTFYIGLFSLYVHPYKSLYVDIPVAVWAAGACMYWLQIHKKEPEEEKNTGNMTIARWILLGLMLFVTSQIKWAVGILMDAFVIFYFMIYAIVQYGWKNIGRFLKKYKLWILGGLVICIILGAFILKIKGNAFLPGNVAATKEALTVSSEKARLTLESMGRNLFTKPLSEYSRLKMTFMPFVAGVFLVLLISGWLSQRRNQRLIGYTIFYDILCTCGYLLVLYVTYVSTFSYDESIKNAAIHRYLSIMAIFMYLITLGTILSREFEARVEVKRNASPMVFLAIIGVIFATGISDKFICKISSRDAKSVYGYQAISETKAGIRKLNRYLKKDDRVYFVAQKYTLEKLNEFPMTTVLYYEDQKVSNYMISPWKFYDGGSLQFVTNVPTQIEQWKDILRDGGYTYIWVYQSDDYFSEKVKQLFGYTEQIRRGLYQIQYLDGQISGLQYVTSL